VVEGNGGHLGQEAGKGREQRPAASPDASGAFADIPKTIGWILGGFALVTAGLGTLTIAPRLAGTYENQVMIALGLMVAAFLAAAVAGLINLAVARGQNSSRKVQVTIVAILAAGVVSLLASLGIMLVSETAVLAKPEVPRLALSVIGNQKPNGDRSATDTVKIKFEADGLDPGQYLTIDVLALPAADPHRKGDRIYHASIGSDSTGKLLSDIQTEIDRTSYKLIIAEVFPVGPSDWLHHSTNSYDLTGYTQFCTDLRPNDSRSCAWAQVPQ
jgi:hypothetical protein